MGFQSLQGIRITPKGRYNTSRFGASFDGRSWPTSFAFGAWIYNADIDIGYSAQPTEIKLSLVLETDDRSQYAAKFDITDGDLKISAGFGGDENLYDIDFNGVTFTDFVLFDFSIDIQPSNKILTVTFKDYSVILDKIYVGLIKRQGKVFVHTAPSLISFPVNCTDCLLNGSSFMTEGQVIRDISFGSYVGIGNKIYDNFANIFSSDNIYRQWERLFAADAATVKFDLNGGFLILGNEEATDEVCGNLANISYNFNQLLASLRIRGLNFNGAFPVEVNDSDFIYKQNYIGTLREVLQQWCSDLAYDFYCEGKNFIGINLNRSIDIKKISDIADPTTEYGQNFALNKNTAVLSYKETNSLNNTFRQSVITANNFARQTKTHNKNVKRYVGIIPLHPIDFSAPSTSRVNRYDLFNIVFRTPAWANSFALGSSDRSRTLDILDGRPFGDIDAAIALGHYDDDLRDIFCQDRAIYGETDAIKYANFKALGMIPLIEITGENEKSTAIEAIHGEIEGDEITNISLDSRYYKVYIGYFYDKFKRDIVNWEKAAASSMYRYGFVAKGLLQLPPYLPNNILQDLSPTAGLYGANGSSVIRVKHNYEPNTNQYFDSYEAPFTELLLYTNFKSAANYLSNDLFISEISNDWGTTQEQFQRNLTLNLGDACVDEFSQDPSYVNTDLSIDKRFQDWKLSLFRPNVNSNMDEIYKNFSIDLNKIDPTLLSMDRTIQNYYDINNNESSTCSKLHLIVLTDTRLHPNISIDFQSRGKEFINPVVLEKHIQRRYEAYIRRLETKTPSICDKSLLQEMCDSILSGRSVANDTDPRYSCILNDDDNIFEEGFNTSYLSSPNSRGLEINIVKNPVRNNSSDKIQKLLRQSDTNGMFHYSDLLDNSIVADQQQATLTIIYPISVEPDEHIYYKGIMTSEVSIENRSPEITEIFGSPPHILNNNTSSVKVINNQVDSDLQPQLDPFTNRFLTYLTVVTGNGQILSTVEQYHNFLNNLNGYQLTGVYKNIDITLAGTPSFFGNFVNYISPIYGLNKMSINVGQEGVRTSLSYSTVPKVLPKQESILNKIGPRIV